MAFINMQMGQFIKGNGKITSITGEDNINFQMGLNMKENGWII